MAIRELRTFLAVVDGGSFAAAANTVGRTHSAISVQMKALEDEFGITLFDRAHRPPVLTPDGRAFLPYAADAVASYDRLFKAAADTRIEGFLRLGVVPSVITGAIPKALVALRERFPALHVELTMGLSKDLVKRVRETAIDAAIVSDFRSTAADMRWSVVAEEPLVLIAPMDAPARRAEEIVSTYPFIRYSRHTWVGRLVEDFLRERRIQVRETMSLDTLEAIRIMVHTGLGVSIVPHRAGYESLDQPVRTLPFDAPARNRTLGVVALEGQGKQALVDALLDVLKAEVASTSRMARGRHRSGAIGPDVLWSPDARALDDRPPLP